MSAKDEKVVVDEPVEEVEEKSAPEPAHEFSIKAPIDNVRIGGDALDQARRYCVTGFK